MGSPKQPARKWDWAKAEQLYISDRTQSHASIAAQFGVAKNSVYQVARKRKWSERRQTVVEKATEQATKAVERDLIELDNNHYLAYDNMVKVGNALLTRLGSKLATGADGKPLYEESALPDARQLASAAQVLEKGIMGQRLVSGLPTIIAKQEGTVEVTEKPTPQEAMAVSQRIQERAKRLERLMNTNEPTRTTAKPKPKLAAPAGTADGRTNS